MQRGSQEPKVARQRCEFISKQGQDIEFNQLGYAFVAGLISDSKDNVEK